MLSTSSLISSLALFPSSLSLFLLVLSASPRNPPIAPVIISLRLPTPSPSKSTRPPNPLSNKLPSALPGPVINHFINLIRRGARIINPPVINPFLPKIDLQLEPFSTVASAVIFVLLRISSSRSFCSSFSSRAFLSSALSPRSFARFNLASLLRSANVAFA